MNLDTNLGVNPNANNSPSLPNVPRNDNHGLVRSSDIPPHIARRAVEWLVELQSGDVSTATRHNLQHWLSLHPDHERAWQHIEAVNGQLRSVVSPMASAIAHATLVPRRSVKRREMIKTLAVLLFAGGTTLVAKDSITWREWTADAHTGVGEQRTVTLADGTIVTLNTDSAINIRFSTTERRVLLVKGEILVNTGKDTDHNDSSGIGNGLSRPFLIETAQGELQPLGTRFVVRQQTDASRIDVFEGAVDIRPHNGVGATRILRAGEQTRFTRNVINEPTVIVSDTDTAWIDGMLVASGMRLADFLAELSRHRPGRLSCDPAIAELRVSGSYPLADTDRILDILRTTLPVKIHFLTRYWVTVRPAHT
ncbi:Iron uptake regulator [Candidatus Nitrotoga sp. HW29]|uniref:FecR domain-containing protein n=1 Tax=Candidatus Nitrotoga sp. HW29 TaxID=2886963 RepID=UPI001EF2BAA2|nr:FecR family protein [Candidatus Nitrotoga sp. HW29]CAH1904003.1 Iron uptake regulator [Candidatus Nitrotoga sp. HW29]